MIRIVRGCYRFEGEAAHLKRGTDYSTLEEVWQDCLVDVGLNHMLRAITQATDLLYVELCAAAQARGVQ